MLVFEWNFLGLSSETKPLNNEKVIDGSTFYECDTSSFFIYYNGNWYKQTFVTDDGINVYLYKFLMRKMFKNAFDTNISKTHVYKPEISSNISFTSVLPSNIAEMEMYGDSMQDGTPMPDSPVNVQTVTGAQTVTMNEGVSSQAYEINLGKNLLKLANYTSGEITTTLNSDGKITVSGTATYNYANFMAYQTPLLSPSGTYTFSRTGDNTYRASLTLFSRDKSQNTSINIAAGSNSATATIPFEIGYVAGAYTNLTVGSELNFTTGLQLEFGSTPTSFAPYFKPIELCKLDDYQDYIYKSGDDWYVHKEIGKVVLNGSETWGATNMTNNWLYYTTNAGMAVVTSSQIPNIICDYFSVVSTDGQWTSAAGSQSVTLNNTASPNTQIRFTVGDNTNKLADFKTWLSTHNTSVYYALATPTDTKITDTTLISSLNSIMSYTFPIGLNYITVSASNLPALLKLTIIEKE